MATGEFLAQYASALFGFLGAVPAADLACVGLARDIGTAGKADVGLLAEGPPQFSKRMILQAIPSTQGLYGLVIDSLVLMKMGLSDGVVTELSIANGPLILVACLSMAIGDLSFDITQDRVAAISVNIVARNPND